MARYKSSQFSDDGISIANQEDFARATDAEKRDDAVYADDFAVIVESLKLVRQRVQTREKFHAWFTMVLNRGAMLSSDQPFDDFRERYGDACAYRAAAKALEA